MKPKSKLYEEGLTREIIGACIEVHQKLGPGLLEATYQTCLCRELYLRELSFQSHKSLPLDYKGARLECGYRLDFMVAELVLLEIKAMEALAPIHAAQVLTYLRLTGLRVGLLINFNVPVMKSGILRLVL